MGLALSGTLVIYFLAALRFPAIGLRFLTCLRAARPPFPMVSR